MMLSRKEIIKKTFDESGSYAETGRRLGISTQRVHQVVTQTLLEITDINGKKIFLCQMCNKEPWKITHHIDHNHYNNNKENLKRLCYSCHLNIHKNDSIKSLKNKRCLVCKRLLLNVGPLVKKRLLCMSCYAYNRNGKSVRLRSVLVKGKKCLRCGKILGKEVKHSSHFYCVGCIWWFNYHRNTKMKIYHREYQRKKRGT